MQLENEALDLERIAKAFRLISKEISYGGLANALLGVAIENTGAVRSTALLSEGGELLAKANASFPREKAQIIATHPPDSEFRLPADCSERVLRHQFDVGPSGDVELEGIITDITEQKAAEQALTDAHAKRAASVRRALHGEG